MLENYTEETPKRNTYNYWLVATICLAILIIIGGLYALYLSGKLPASLFSSSRKIEGEIFIVTQGGENFKLGLVQVCAVPEQKILDWLDAKQDRAKIEVEKAKRLTAGAQIEKAQAEQDYKNAQALYSKFDAIFNADPLAPRALENSQNALSTKFQKQKILNDKTDKVQKAQESEVHWFSAQYYLEGLNDCETTAKTNADGKFSLILPQKKYALAARATRKVINKTEEYYWLIWITPETIINNPLMLSNDNLMDANPSDKVLEIKNYTSQ